MKKSKTSTLVENILKLLNNKKNYISKKNAMKAVKKRKKKNAKRYKVPNLYKKFATRKVFDNAPFDNFDYYFKKGNEKVILYLHGGAFISRPLIFHWIFLNDLHERTKATIIFPIYPLAPKYNFRQTYIALMNLYQKIIERFPAENITIMGDSAGATLSLGLTNKIKEEKLPMPKLIVPMSPSLDITFSNPQIPNYEKVDPVLAQVGCAYICGIWARGADYDNPLVSPKFADIEKFPKTLMFYGTHEILCPEIKKFVKDIKNKNFNLYTIEKIGMNHAYPLLPIPEAEEAKQLIAKFINE